MHNTMLSATCALIACAAFAQAAPEEEQMTFPAPVLAAKIDAAGVRQIAPGEFDRFVANDSECRAPDVATPVWAKSGALLGYVCRFSPSGG